MEKTPFNPDQLSFDPSGDNELQAPIVVHIDEAMLMKLLAQGEQVYERFKREQPSLIIDPADSDMIFDSAT
jgi:hypothetical protein